MHDKWRFVGLFYGRILQTYILCLCKCAVKKGKCGVVKAAAKTYKNTVEGNNFSDYNSLLYEYHNCVIIPN